MSTKNKNKILERIYFYLLIWIAIISLANTLATWVKQPIQLFNRVEACELRIERHEKVLDSINSTLKEILLKI